MSRFLAFNCRRISRKQSSFKRHNKERQTTLSIYLSVKVPVETKKIQFKDTLAALEMGISYKLIMNISSQIANSVTRSDRFVARRSMLRKLFTVGIVDNIDHIPSSTTASDSFQGTDISLIQPKEVEDGGNEHSVPLFYSKHECQGILYIPEK
ncbi:hypothetical protein PoB_006654600 [Plakobranchus ocellatus]|uniref:Uncharacterized protein n=1 Tax=Plakobranchus ocellatus TaxID=259542 RepID=A0AAV4D7L9_9GAST|nr:hypothetical protein PoB_006654600 [Plakobranchus ocellatus]